MENLKFRAKANLDDEWVYASNIHKIILDDTNEELWVMHPKNEKIEHLGDGYIKYRPLVVNEETIGQYTGFKDKNGVEIYEGDILGKELHSNLEVKFKDGLFVAERNEYDGLFIFAAVERGYEVVGNIYENKELLK